MLFVIKATDNRIGGGNSKFIKSLKLLKDKGDLLTRNYVHLIVVVTHVLGLGPKKEKILEKFIEIKRIVSNAVWNTFGLSEVDVDVVPI